MLIEARVPLALHILSLKLQFLVIVYRGVVNVSILNIYFTCHQNDLILYSFQRISYISYMSEAILSFLLSTE